MPQWSGSSHINQQLRKYTTGWPRGHSVGDTFSMDVSSSQMTEACVEIKVASTRHKFHLDPIKEGKFEWISLHPSRSTEAKRLQWSKSESEHRTCSKDVSHQRRNELEAGLSVSEEITIKGWHLYKLPFSFYNILIFKIRQICMYLCVVYAQGYSVWGEERRASDPLELESQAVKSPDMGTIKWTQIFCKSSLCALNI